MSVKIELSLRLIIHDLSFLTLFLQLCTVLLLLLLCGGMGLLTFSSSSVFKHEYTFLPNKQVQQPDKPGLCPDNPGKRTDKPWKHTDTLRKGKTFDQ